MKLALKRDERPTGGHLCVEREGARHQVDERRLHGPVSSADPWAGPESFSQEAVLYRAPEGAGYLLEIATVTRHLGGSDRDRRFLRSEDGRRWAAAERPSELERCEVLDRLAVD